MDKKTIDRLLTIASVGLLLSAAIFICLWIFAAEKSQIYVGAALGSLLLSSLFNVIRRQNVK